jgi:hypothetical protein
MDDDDLNWDELYSDENTTTTKNRTDDISEVAEEVIVDLMQETETAPTPPHQQLFDIKEEDVSEELEVGEDFPSDEPQTPQKRYNLMTDRSYEHRLDHAMDDPENTKSYDPLYRLYVCRWQFTAALFQ